MIGDGLLIYRCWIIWQRSWWIVSAPSFFLAATTAVGWIVVWEYSQITQGSNIFQGQIKILVPVTFVLSLVTNLLTTALVIYRIRIVSAAVQRSMPKDRSQSEPYRHTLSVIIESGAIYPAILVLTLVLYGAKRNEQALLTGAMCQSKYAPHVQAKSRELKPNPLVIGIVPTLTILQVRLGYSSYDKAYANRNTPSNNQNFNLGSMSYPPTPGTATFGQIGPARKSGTTSRAMSRSSSDQHTYYRNTVDLDSLDVSSDLGTPTKFPSKTYATLNAQDEKWTRAPSPSLGLPIHIEVSNHRQLNAMKNSTRPMSIHLQRSTESHWDEETLRDSGKTRDDDDMVIEFRRMSEDSPKATSNPYPQPWTVTRTWSR